MPRYLSPGRICLLVLIELYLSGQTASSARQKVLSFIASHLDGNTGHELADLSEVLESTEDDAAQFADRLSQWPSDIPGRSVQHALLQRLWRLNGLDSLYSLFQTLRSHLEVPSDGEADRVRLSGASPLGQFVRRCAVEYMRMQFTDTQTLWNAFVTYRAPTYDQWAQKYPIDVSAMLAEVELGGIDPTVSLDNTSDTASGYTSSDDVNSLLTFSIHRLQKLGTRMPDDVKQRLQQWMVDQSDSGVQSLQHFLAFFEHWKAGQYTMALESIHRYFDYSLVGKSTGSESNMRVYYQYALLHLSVLHADFDCWEQSMDAMDECIATARENQDKACLNFALSWLLYLRQAKPRNLRSSSNADSLIGGGGGQQDEIAFLEAQARETKHWTLLSSTLLEEAKLEMYSVRPPNSTNVAMQADKELQQGITTKSVEHVMQSAFLNVRHDLRTLISATSLFQAATFERLGQAHLARRLLENIKTVHGAQCPLSDNVRSVCRLAYGLAQTGKYTVALQSLEKVMNEARGVLKFEHRIIGYTTLVQLLKSLRHGHLNAADYYAAQLQPFRSFCDPEIEFEFELLSVELLMKRKDFAAALDHVNTCLEQLKSTPNSDIAQRIHFLVLKSRIFIAGGQPAKGFSIALRAATTAHRLRLVPALTEAIVALAAIMNSLSGFETARELLEVTLPLAIESQQVKLVAEIYQQLGECNVGIAGHVCSPGSSEQAQRMRAAREYLQRSQKAFLSLEDKRSMADCLVMQAQIARWSGDEGSAAQAEDECLQLLAAVEAETGQVGQ